MSDFSNREQGSPDELVETLTVPGAMLVADSTVYDPGDMHKIALKVLAHELRRLRVATEDISQLRLTPPKTRAQLRHAVAGVDWRKVK
ncbi:MAG: hypothetical protein IRZ07_00630 [Microbispora sp.]|nr:hypothetical protein [Microbispora sp.]